MHFGDFTCVQLRSFLLLSLQLRLQFVTSGGVHPPWLAWAGGGGARPALDRHGGRGLFGSPAVGTARCPAGFTLREHGVGRAIRGPHVDL